MNRGKVRIQEAPRAVPKLIVGQTYDIVIRQGKEFILDGYNGWVPLPQIGECQVKVVSV